MNTVIGQRARTFRVAIAFALVIAGCVFSSTPFSAPPVHAARPAAPTDDFVITVKTNKYPYLTNTQFTIPTTGTGYNYNVDCNNDGTNEATAQTGDYTCNYGAAGTYTVRIKDNTGAGTGFPRIYFKGSGDNCKLETIEQWGTGKWTSMESAFYQCYHVQGVATDSPDLSGVTDTSYMFYQAHLFNQDIGDWNTASVTNMSNMFASAIAFDQDIGDWNTSNVTNMSGMFLDTNTGDHFPMRFNQVIGAWDTAKVTDMSFMFKGNEYFDQDIGGWNTASVTNMSGMFSNGASFFPVPFNQDIGNWNTTNVTDMSRMFAYNDQFNQDIGGWNTANVTNMSGMFDNAHAFNQDISNWDTAAVTDTSFMFSGAVSFNQEIGQWNTANVTNMFGMLSGARAFNQDIGNWNTSNVTHMGVMFADSRAFNKDIGSWNTANVTDMGSMFQGASKFDQNIGGWNTANVTNMSGMFWKASAFDQNLGNWDISALTNARGMFGGVTLSTANYDALLIGWNAQMLKQGVPFSGGKSKYCAGEAARSHMIYTDGWKISDGGKGKPTKPKLSKPLDNGNVSHARVKLKWEPVVCADNYTVTVKNTATSDVVFETTISDPLISKAKTEVLPAGTYEWFVKACNALGCAKSAKFTFGKP